MRLEVALPTAKRGFVLYPPLGRRTQLYGWSASAVWPGYERLAETLVGLHFVAFAILMAQRFVAFMAQCA